MPTRPPRPVAADMMSAAAAAKLRGVGVQAIYRAIRDGRLAKCGSFGRSYLLRGADVRRMPLAKIGRPRIVHGVSCPKMPHVGTGHLHGKDDDGPYGVDGVTYCGRCHARL